MKDSSGKAAGGSNYTAQTELDLNKTQGQQESKVVGDETQDTSHHKLERRHFLTGFASITASTSALIVPEQAMAFYNLTGFLKNNTFKPDAFGFTNQTGVSLNTSITSNPATLTGPGPRGATAVCTGCLIQKNGAGPFTSTLSGIRSGDYVRIQITSSSSYSTAVTCSVKIGTTTSSTWSVTTTLPSQTINVTYPSSGNAGRNVMTDVANGVYASPIWNGTSVVNLTITINAGVIIGAPNPSTPALTIPGGWPPGSTISLVNNGTVSGAGGAGGVGSDNTGPGGDGTKGGSALSLQWQTSITNNGTIAGGGGGGGGAADHWNIYSGFGGGGGGGGAGSVPGAGGVGGTAGSGSGSSGSAGTASSGGAGGAGGSIDLPGGNGGNLGQAGADGANPGGSGYTTPGTGGAAGYYIVGNSFATWNILGTVIGGLI
jgi:hypothetical protein